MVSFSMTLSDPWPGFQGRGSFKRRISPRRRILQTQLLYRTLIGNHRQAIDRQAIATQLTTPLLLHKPCKRFDVSQASRGFVSDSWPFLYLTITRYTSTHTQNKSCISVWVSHSFIHQKRRDANQSRLFLSLTKHTLRRHRCLCCRPTNHENFRRREFCVAWNCLPGSPKTPDRKATIKRWLKLHIYGVTLVSVSVLHWLFPSDRILFYDTTTGSGGSFSRRKLNYDLTLLLNCFINFIRFFHVTDFRPHNVCVCLKNTYGHIGPLCQTVARTNDDRYKWMIRSCSCSPSSHHSTAWRSRIRWYLRRS